MVRMIAPLGNVTVPAPDAAPCDRASTTLATGLVDERRPSPAPTPSRLMACRRLNCLERESSIVVSPYQKLYDKLKSKTLGSTMLVGSRKFAPELMFRPNSLLIFNALKT